MKKLVLIYLLSFTFVGFAQQKKLTIEDAVIGQWRQLYPTYLNGLDWRNDNEFTQVIEWKQIVSENVKTGKKNTVITLEGFNKILKSSKIAEMKHISAYEWRNENILQFEHDNRLILYNVEDVKIDLSIKITEKAKNIHICEKTNSVAFTLENNLYMVDNKSNQIQITNDKNKGIVNGDAYVHRQEFGIIEGIFWSPDGQKIAFYRKDETMVDNYPIVDVSARIANLENSKYPMAGETSEEVTLGVYDVKSKKTVFMKTGTPKDQYLTSITWDPNSEHIYIGVLNRDQNHVKLNKYNAVNGDLIKTLFEEKNEKYVEPENQLLFLKNNPSKFIWFSERDGYNHLYLYDNEGNLIKQLTKGNWVVTGIVSFDAKGEKLFIQATKDSPLESNVYQLNMKKNTLTRLTADKGTHDFYVNSGGTYFIDSYTNIENPRQIDLFRINGKKIRNLLQAKNPLVNYALGKMEIGTLKSADTETDLYYRLIKPVNFDPTKKYPVIVYVYGGPHAQMVTDSWLGGARMWQYFMAQKGYVVFTLDNRGSANRGFDFESIIHRQCGVAEMADQMEGINWLKAQSFVDKDRIGVHGWSYGGFMTTSLMTKYPDVFKVGAAGGPVIDWKYYEVMYGERYMDTPQTNPEGYAKTSLLTKAKGLKGRLLMIHGAVDPVVVWQNSQAFLNACVKDGVLIDYMVYPSHEHNVRGMDRIHLMRTITRYFDDFL